MEFGRDDEPSKNGAEPGRKSEVGVGKDLDDERNPSVSHNLSRREPDHQDDCTGNNTVEDRLDGMVPKGCGDIDFRIGVVDQMEVPKDVDSVQQSMLRVS